MKNKIWQNDQGFAHAVSSTGPKGYSTTAYNIFFIILINLYALKKKEYLFLTKNKYKY
jgi:hypothetical protein